MNGDKENIALVTGAATRIGRGIAASIAEAGWAVPAMVQTAGTGVCVGASRYKF